MNENQWDVIWELVMGAFPEEEALLILAHSNNEELEKLANEITENYDRAMGVIE